MTQNNTPRALWEFSQRDIRVCAYQTFPGLHRWPKTTFSWRFLTEITEGSAACCSAWSMGQETGLQLRSSFAYCSISCQWLCSTLRLKYHLFANLLLLIFNRGSPPPEVTLSANAPANLCPNYPLTYMKCRFTLSMGNKSRPVDFELVPKFARLSTLARYDLEIWKISWKTLIVMVCFSSKDKCCGWKLILKSLLKCSRGPITH